MSLSIEAISTAILHTSSADKGAGKTAEAVVVVVVVVVILGSTEVTKDAAEVLGSIINNKRIA